MRGTIVPLQQAACHLIFFSTSREAKVLSSLPAAPARAKNPLSPTIGPSAFVGGLADPHIHFLDGELLQYIVACSCGAPSTPVTYYAAICRLL